MFYRPRILFTSSSVFFSTVQLNLNTCIGKGHICVYDSTHYWNIKVPLKPTRIDLKAVNDCLLERGWGMLPSVLCMNLRHCKVFFFQRKILLDTNSTNLALQGGESPLLCASDTGETECVKVLVKYGAQVDLPVRHDIQK